MRLLESIAASRRRTGAFDPSTLLPSIWVDATDSTTLFDAAAGGSPVGNGGSVGRWQDKSSNLRHYTQTTAGLRPTRISAAASGYDVVRFSGTQWLNNALALALLNAAPGATVIMAYKWNTLPVVYTNAFWVSTSSSSTSVRFGMGGGITAGQQHVISRRTDAGSPVQSLCPMDTALQVHTGIIDHTAATIQHYKNAVLQESKATGLGTAAFDSTNSLRVSLGTHDTSNYSQIDIAEVFAWNRALTPSELASMHTFMTNKYVPA